MTWRNGIAAGLSIGVALASGLTANARGGQQPQADQKPPEVRALPPAPVTRLDGVAAGQSQPQTPPTTQRPGQAPATLPAAPVTQVDRQTPSEAGAADQHFGLSFSEPQPIRDILILLVGDTGLSVVLDPDVEGTFAGELKNVNLRQALNAVLAPLNLQYTIEDNILRVSRRHTETRIFNINYVATRRSGSRGTSASTSTGGVGFTGTTLGTVAGGGVVGAAGGGAFGGVGANAFGGGGGSVSSTDSTDFFGDLEKGVNTLKSPEGKYNLDRKAGILQVDDYPDRLDKIGIYLDAAMLRVNRQVQIQAQVIEVDLNQDSSSGINWNAVLNRAGDSVTLTQQLVPTNTPSAFTLGLNIGNFTALLQAFASQGNVKVLSNPRVAAMNNEPAIMRVGTQDVFFVTTSQVDATTGRILQTTVTPQTINEGVVLSVTPQISGDGIIHMSISPTVTERTGQATSRLGDTVPITAVRETDTLVRVHEGETIVIGGLIQERASVDRTKVPVLSSIPLLGPLFQQKTTSKRRAELVILLTPTIATPDRIAADAARQQQKIYEAQRAPIKK